LTLLVGQQEGHPAGKKTEWWGAGVVICLERGTGLHIAQLMPLLLTVSGFNKIQIGFTFLVPAHPGSPGQRAVKRVCVFAILALYMLSPRVHQSVRHKAVLYSNNYVSSWFLAWELPLTYPELCYKEIRETVKMRILPSGTLPPNLDLEILQWQVDGDKTHRQSCLWITPTTVDCIIWIHSL